MKKIMFSDEFGLTQAVLDGRKTMTRRIIEIDECVRFPIIRFRPLENWEKKVVNPNYVFNGHVYAVYNELDLLCHLVKPRYEIGEVVAIAQSYSDCGNMPDYELDEDGYPIMPKNSGFFNKMFVKADLMPHHIKITGIKVERLQDISDEDCLKEGIVRQEVISDESPLIYAYDAFLNGENGYFASQWFKNPKEAFAVLIDKVSGKGVFQSNPYVFAYEFRLTE
ncbi:hypothetical protein K0F82_12595 [Bacteroides ovatus]|jgi:hypothetical protein|uniref:ASCH domain protein n=1 Tax=Siphoviridae sp. ctHGG8 TaxID=2826230 RepID=A0A8S5N6J2_9CAUD|nr:hypothetical protein [Bacteroides ovatus]KAA3994676.1 hypothetical protein F3F40_15400 [Bacteroides ovatus]KAA3994872.1 hypothetical protein F3D58_14750 [Bacteroides ovatus]MCE8751774.1 hypothetical protein [Bacteroides ovatus]DAD89890.1 MAG TPA: ASCH domain protein [Siphoviridae sp. ctHGG8]